jgi:hypothetical protein
MAEDWNLGTLLGVEEAPYPDGKAVFRKTASFLERYHATYIKANQKKFAARHACSSTNSLRRALLGNCRYITFEEEAEAKFLPTPHMDLDSDEESDIEEGFDTNRDPDGDVELQGEGNDLAQVDETSDVIEVFDSFDPPSSTSQPPATSNLATRMVSRLGFVSSTIPSKRTAQEQPGSRESSRFATVSSRQVEQLPKKRKPPTCKWCKKTVPECPGGTNKKTTLPDGVTMTNVCYICLNCKKPYPECPDGLNFDRKSLLRARCLADCSPVHGPSSALQMPQMMVPMLQTPLNPYLNFMNPLHLIQQQHILQQNMMHLASMPLFMPMPVNNGSENNGNKSSTSSHSNNESSSSDS